jgi:hypothetical protein
VEEAAAPGTFVLEARAAERLCISLRPADGAASLGPGGEAVRALLARRYGADASVRDPADAEAGAVVLELPGSPGGAE